MKTRFLFPYWCRYLGYGLFLVHVPITMFSKQLGFEHSASADNQDLLSSHHIFFMLTTLLMALGLFLAAFSKEKIEDEQISQLRLDSLQWAIYLNYALLLIVLIFTTDIHDVLFLNLIVPLVFFIIRFRWVIFRLNRSLPKEG